jgi:hypothetical protein
MSNGPYLFFFWFTFLVYGVPTIFIAVAECLGYGAAPWWMYAWGGGATLVAWWMQR